MLRFENINFGKVELYLLYYDNIYQEDWESSLSTGEKQEIQTFGHPAKREEYIATKILRTHLFGVQEIQYSLIGAPFIPEEDYISISHSYQVIGIATCKDFEVGLDLEPIREKALLVKDKFLSEEERKVADLTCEEEMTKFWSGKEALYKLAGRKKIIFKESLLLEHKKEDNWEGKLIFSEKKRKVDLQIIKKDNFIISLNIGPTHAI